MRNIFRIPDDAVNRQKLGFFKRFLTAIQYFYASFERLLVFIIEDATEGQRSLETLLRSLHGKVDEITNKRGLQT